MTKFTDAQSTILAGLSDFRAKEQIATNDVNASQIVAALNQFKECVRYLNTRRSKGTKLSLSSEADVQDAIYLMLRPWVHDLVAENPTDKIGNRFSVKDFLAKSARTVIEAKFIRDQQHGKHISKELHDDIETYRHHAQCDNLIFFIYDPEDFIPDVGALKAEIHVARSYDGRALHCQLIVP